MRHRKAMIGNRRRKPPNIYLRAAFIGILGAVAWLAAHLAAQQLIIYLSNQ